MDSAIFLAVGAVGFVLGGALLLRGWRTRAGAGALAGVILLLVGAFALLNAWWAASIVGSPADEPGAPTAVTLTPLDPTRSP
jgi:uncharacterized membrane protein YphA (DoxX/SURF4 family)